MDNTILLNRVEVEQMVGLSRSSIYHLMRDDILLTRVEVEQMVGLSRSSIYRLMRANKFPLPKKIGPRAIRWPAGDIFNWISTRPRATGEAHESTDEAGARKKNAN